jgi:YfiH family protein
LIRQLLGSLVAYEFESLRPQRNLAHGIFTRHGGVSPTPWHSLNLSTATGDSRDNIDENYRRMYGALGHSPADAVISRQVHGRSVAVISRAQRGRQLDDCDGLVTDAPGVVLLQRHADCAPILLYDPKCPAVGIAHAGWRGTLAGISVELVDVMCEAFGSRPGDLVAAIGPAIGVCCYDVGEEVQRAFVERHADARRWLRSGDDGKTRLDLWEANRALLEAAGVRQIEVAGICTACNVGNFYSARAENRMNGCFGALIALT